MKSNNKITGNLGEQLAADFLIKNGYKIIERNWHFSRIGEVDIIAMHKDTLIFVEVKTRKTANFGHPLEAITYAKTNQLRNLASAFIQENTNIKYKNFRIDAIGILLSNNKEITHYQNVCQF
ncbi:MAG: YraN family protein [Candidatus Gastranaerophilales bacterium]|nr:YraN family protein [Candidatus Gastranaerophilales bacterium]